MSVTLAVSGGVDVALPASISELIREVERPDGHVPDELPVVAVNAVRDALRLVEARCEPGSPDAWKRLMMPLATHAQNIPLRAELDAYFRSVAVALAVIPSAIFTEASKAELLRTFKFWPTPAELYAWAHEAMRPVRAIRQR